MGYEKGEKECIKPRAGDADLWLKKIGRNYMHWKLGGSGTCEGTPHEERKKKR